MLPFPWTTASLVLLFFSLVFMERYRPSPFILIFSQTKENPVLLSFCFRGPEGIQSCDPVVFRWPERVQSSYPLVAVDHQTLTRFIFLLLWTKGKPVLNLLLFHHIFVNQRGSSPIIFSFPLNHYKFDPFIFLFPWTEQDPVLCICFRV